MIRTENLIELIETELAREYTHSDLDREYFGEIAVRLRAYDKLKESIEQLLAKI